METSARKQFNEQFSTKKYQKMLQSIEDDFGYFPTFRIAESPLFVSDAFKSQLLEACSEVISFIQQPGFKELTQKAVELNKNIPKEDEHPEFLAIDFGVCEENGEIIPKLIEVQGFPSLFHFQANLFEKFKVEYPFLESYSPYLSGLNKDSYLSLLQKIILNNHLPENVILLEVEPEKQNTKIDFYYASKTLGIPILCVTDIFPIGNKLFYKNELGDSIPIHRIYNRVIFDELDMRTDLNLKFDFTKVWEVEWAGHPNWFFRISKFILPYLQGKYFIETTLLSELKAFPDDLENYVLKPIFSFSGAGVVFHVKKNDIEAVQQKDLYVLQKKVFYKPIVQSTNGLVKAEIRMLCLWPKEEAQPTIANTLVRFSRGEMIGVKFNKDKDWVGGTTGVFKL